MPNVYEVITNRILKQLEGGVAPWHRPWRSRGRSGLPRNVVSGREYRGINLWILVSSGFSSQNWVTFRQAEQLGGHVRKGETGLPVVYWNSEKREVQEGDQVIEKSSILCRYYTVFNVEQCEGVNIEASQPDEPLPEPIEACEHVVNLWRDQPNLIHGGTHASYNKLTDSVLLPSRSQFESAAHYYATLFHEWIHSTGHPNRLNRSTLTNFETFGDSEYSREELVAEMGAAFLCGYCGIVNAVIDNSAAYLASWLRVLKSDSRMVLIAASQAQRAADLILNVTQPRSTESA